MSGSAVRIVGASHGDGATSVLEAVFTFVDDALSSWLLRENLAFLGEAAALDHESVDDAVEYRAVVLFFLHVSEEVLDRDGCFFCVHCDDDVTFGGF